MSIRMDHPSLNNFPDEILQQIFSYISVRDLILKVSHVCTRWRDLVNDPLLWENCKFYCSNNIPLCIALGVLSQAKHLRHLHVNRKANHAGERSVLKVSFKNCKRLRTLKVENTCLEELALFQQAVKHFPELRVLHLDSPYSRRLRLESDESSQESDDDDAGMPSLQSLYKEREFLNLISLILPSCRTLTTNNFKVIVDMCKNLEVLDVQHSNTLRGSDFIYLVEQRKNTLVSLKLPGNLLTDEFYMRLKACQKLKIFSVENCTRLTDKSLPSIGSCKLHSLTLKATKATPRGLCNFFIAGNFSKLITLDLSKCNVDDEVTKAISHNCPSLQKLYVDYCLQITHIGVRNVLEECRHLKHLSLEGNDTFSKKIVNAISCCGISLNSLSMDKRLKTKIPGIEFTIQDSRKLDVTWC